MCKFWMAVVFASCICFGVCVVEAPTLGQGPGPTSKAPPQKVDSKKVDPKQKDSKGVLGTTINAKGVSTTAVTNIPVTAGAFNISATLIQELSSAHPAKVWFVLYSGHSPTIPDLPRVPPSLYSPSTTPTGIYSTWNYAINGVTTSEAGLPYTLVIWAYFTESMDAHTIYERIIYKVNAQTQAPIHRATLQGPLTENAKIELAETPAGFTITTNKYGSVNPTRVLYKNLPGTMKGTFPIEKFQGVREAASPPPAAPTDLRHWMLLADDIKVSASDGSPGDNTLVIWAVYSVNGAEIYQADSIRYQCKKKK